MVGDSSNRGSGSGVDALAARRQKALALGPDCERCPYAKEGQPDRPVLGEGPSNPIGILVGEGPGREEVEAGRPYVGITGRQLDDELFAVGLLREKLFIVYATMCWPTKRGERESRLAAQCCRPALLRALKPFDPSTPTFAMGKWAVFALTGKDKGVMGARGFVRSSFELGSSVPGGPIQNSEVPVRESGEVDEDNDD